MSFNFCDTKLQNTAHDAQKSWRMKNWWIRDMKSRCSYDTKSILSLSTFWAIIKRNLIFATKSSKIDPHQNVVVVGCCRRVAYFQYWKLYSKFVQHFKWMWWLRTKIKFLAVNTNEHITVCISNWFICRLFVVACWDFHRIRNSKIELLNAFGCVSDIFVYLACYHTKQKFGFFRLWKARWILWES